MSFWDDLLETAVDVAPTLAGAAATIATGGNPAAGAIVSAVARKITGAGKGESLNDIAADILGDPEKIQAFRLEMRQLELEELKIRTMDVQNARGTLQYSNGALVMSVVVVVAYFSLSAAVIFLGVKAGSEQLAYLILGNLGTGFGMALTFWLGSSVGSKVKDNIMQMYSKIARKDIQQKEKQLERTA